MIVGYISVSLPIVLFFGGFVFSTCSGWPIKDSMSHYFYTPFLGEIFVGALCVIGGYLIFFLAPNAKPDGFFGFDAVGARLIRWAGVFAILVALFPTVDTGCEVSDGWVRAYADLDVIGSVEEPTKEGSDTAGQSEGNPKLRFDFLDSYGWNFEILGFSLSNIVHYLPAGGIFVLMGVIALCYFTRKNLETAKTGAWPSTKFEEDYTQRKRVRNRLYKVFGSLILACAGALVVGVFVDAPWWTTYNLTFLFEAIGLVSFGVCWLVKGRVFKCLADP